MGSTARRMSSTPMRRHDRSPARFPALRDSAHRSSVIAPLTCILLAALGCAKGFNPTPPEQTGFLERAQTQTEDGVTVTAAVPSAAETQALFSLPLYRSRIQPVWIEIDNQLGEGVDFLPVGLDPLYFSPIEAANIELGDDPEKSNDARNRYFHAQKIQTHIPAGEKRSGFIFTSLDEGTKAFNIDVLAAERNHSFTFFIPVPGLKIDHHQVDWDHLYPADEIGELDDDALIEALEKSPSNATNVKGEGTADPLNLVVIGSLDDVYYAFLRAGWDETETITRSSLMKTFASFFTGGEYRYSPVSSLFVFGRGQDVAFQTARDNIHERNHLRLWMTPMRYRGKHVFLGQISRDIGVRFTPKTITTHKIDPNVDETREFLLENLAYSQALEKFTYVGGVGESTMDDPGHNLTGDPYFTDGYRVVLWVSSQPVDFRERVVVEWGEPPN
jgi:hypothetical protein